MAARKVPSGVKVPMWSSYSTASCQGRPVQASSRQRYSAGSTTSLGPCTSAGWKRDAGSGTSSPSGRRKR